MALGAVAPDIMLDHALPDLADLALHEGRSYKIHPGWGFSQEPARTPPPGPCWKDFQKGCEKKAHALLQEYGMPYIHHGDKKFFGMEVGDDRVTASQSTLPLALCHVVQEDVMMMETSKEDTFISNSLFNLAEVTSVIPRSVEGSFHKSRKSGKLKALEFVDTPALRTIIDVGKGDKSHSSTAVGKASFIRSRMQGRAEVEELMNISSFLQDGYLNTARSPDPKYLPVLSGGTGSPGLFGRWENIYLYVHAYKGGEYARIYGSATEEIRKTVDSLDNGEQVQSLILNMNLRKRGDYLHGTYEAMIAVPTKETLSTSDLPPPIYERLGIDSGAQGPEQRLVRTKRLISRSTAEVEIEKTRRAKEVLFGGVGKSYQDKALRAKRKEKSKAVEGAIHANSAFRVLLERKANEEDIYRLFGNGFEMSNIGVKTFTDWHAQFIANGLKGDMYEARDFHHAEDMYIRTEISTEESFKVGGIPLRQVDSQGNISVRTTVTKVGLWQITESMEEWADNVIGELIKSRETYGPTLPRYEARRIFTENREWAADDPLIAAAIKEAADRSLVKTDSLGVITTDAKMCRSIAYQANIRVVMIDPVSVASFMVGVMGENNPYSAITDRNAAMILRGQINRYGRGPVKIYVDSGSFGAHLASREVITEQRRGRLYTRDVSSVPPAQNGKRVEEYVRRAQPYTGLKTTVFDPKKVNRLPTARVYETRSTRMAHSDGDSQASASDRSLRELS